MAQRFSKLDIKTIKDVRFRSDAFDVNLHINPASLYFLLETYNYLSRCKLGPRRTMSEKTLFEFWLNYLIAKPLL